MIVATKKEWLASLREVFKDEDERQHQIAYLLRVGALLALASWLLVGCATPHVPICAGWGYTPVEFNGERAVLLDQEDIGNLKRLISGLAEGKCRLPPDGKGA